MIVLPFAMLMSAIIGSADTSLDLQRIKAFISVPFTDTRHFEKAQISLVEIGAEGTSRVVQKISLSQVKASAEWRMEFSRDSEMTLNLLISPDQQIEIARLPLEDGWYAPAELCKDAASNMKCRYEIIRNSETKSLMLHVVKDL